jgi:serine/threonine protein phosphatase PrpC
MSSQPMLGHTEQQRLGAHVRVAARTDVGKVRKKNEDSFLVADLDARAASTVLPVRLDVGAHGVLFAVADGMGGAEAGDVAATLALDDLHRVLETPPAGVPRAAMMNHAILHAHRALRKASEGTQAERVRMGTTLTAVLVQGGEAIIGQVGDSRAYLIRGGRIVPLTHDQTVVQQLQDMGLLDPRDASESPFKNVILQAVGHQAELDVAIIRLELRSRDLVVLTTDGLTNVVSDEELLDVVLSSLRLDIAADRLIDLANARGGKDNATALLAGIGGDLPMPDAAQHPSGTMEVVKEYRQGAVGASQKAKASSR